MSNRHLWVKLLPVLLLLVFSVLSLLLILGGANVYKGVVARTHANSEIRTSLSYVANKVRAYDIEGGVRVTNRNGTDVLLLSETVGDTSYETLIYFYQNSLRESYLRQGMDFDPAQGTSLAEVTAFSAARDGKLLRLSMSGSEKTDCQTSLSLQSE